MKGSVGIALLLIAIFFVPSVTSLRQIGQPNSRMTSASLTSNIIYLHHILLSYTNYIPLNRSWASSLWNNYKPRNVLGKSARCNEEKGRRDGTNSRVKFARLFACLRLLFAMQTGHG